MGAKEKLAIALLLALQGLLVSGCANFERIRDFAKDGSTVAAAAKNDIEMFSASCADLKAERALLNQALAPGASGAAAAAEMAVCKDVASAAQAAAESLSVQLLVRYHEALEALASDSGWSVQGAVEALGSEVKKVRVDGKSLASGAELDKYQGAFAKVVNLLTASLRERSAKALLSQELDWEEVLRPLRFWYGGKDGKSLSPYSSACLLVLNEWSLVQSELLDFARCEHKTASGAIACEPLAAGARLLAIESKRKPVAGCAARAGQPLPQAALSRVKLIDDWVQANAELRRSPFDKNTGSLRARLSALREQAEAIKNALN